MVLFQQIILSDDEWATSNYAIEIRVKGHKYLASVKRNTCISSFEVVNCSLLHHNYVPLPQALLLCQRLKTMATLVNILLNWPQLQKHNSKLQLQL